jgi:ABC-type glycerol-3-phosphate transport system permease component
MKQSMSYRIFSVCNIIFFVILGIVMLFPMYKVFITSIITAGELYSSPLVLWPKEPTLVSYQFLFSNDEILTAVRLTAAVTILGTFLSMFFTLTLSYALSKNFVPGGKIVHRILLVTMFLDSGLIPYFLLVRSLGLTNNWLVNIIPSLVSLWNYLVIRSFFKQLPQSLEEAALIDGAGWFSIFFRIVVPLSMPVIATFTLFYAVGYWNTWWEAMLFCNDTNLQTLQLFLRRLVVTNRGMDTMRSSFATMRGARVALFNESLKMAACIVATVPILVVYPFLQKHFAKGVMIGAIKG